MRNIHYVRKFIAIIPIFIVFAHEAKAQWGDYMACGRGPNLIDYGGKITQGYLREMSSYNDCKRRYQRQMLDERRKSFESNKTPASSQDEPPGFTDMTPSPSQNSNQVGRQRVVEKKMNSLCTSFIIANGKKLCLE